MNLPHSYKYSWGTRNKIFAGALQKPPAWCKVAAFAFLPSRIPTMKRCRSLTLASRAKAGGKKVNSHSVAQYIAERTRDLAVLARCVGREDLAYMLEVATIEAENTGGVPKGCSVS